MIPFARIDPDFAKEQLLLLLREWYMHPNGQIPAYEFAFGDVNPPVHAWAVWRVYKMTGARGQRDRLFLERAFQKLLLNFTWWVNRKDPEGRNLFAGGFLGMDNVGVFDRSQPLPTGGHLEQADGTAWMAFYCNTMLSMALELASEDPAYEDLASKFFEHFIAIADAMNHLGGSGLWSDDEGFYYDQLHVDGQHIPLRVRSMVGVLPLIAVEVLEEESFAHLEGFKRRMNWFLTNRTDVTRDIACMRPRDRDGTSRRLLAIPTRDRLERMLRYVLDETEFLAPNGLRSVSRAHREHPYQFDVMGMPYRVDYVPAEGNTGLFGGNSNWRGPIWFPVNFLVLEALERYHHFYGDDLKVECPVGSGTLLTLQEVALELESRLSRLFLADQNGRRPCHGDETRYAVGPALAEPGALSRVLRRRQRARRGREPPDRVDRARRALPGGHRPAPGAGRHAVQPAEIAAPRGEPAMSSADRDRRPHRVAGGGRPRRLRLGNHVRHPHPALSRAVAGGDDAADRPHSAGQRARRLDRAAGRAGRVPDAAAVRTGSRRSGEWGRARRVRRRAVAHLELASSRRR